MQRKARSRDSQEPASSSASADARGDREFVAGAIAGSRPDFDKLIERYQRQAVAVAFRLLGNTDDALEVVQDAFLKAYRSLSMLERPEAFGGWMLRIVANLSLNFRRSRKVRRQLPLDDAMTPPTDSPGRGGAGSEWMSRDADPIRSAEGKELGQKLTVAMEQLPEKQRLAIVLFTIEQMPQKDVAEVLECSVEAVKWHVFQGRKRLKELLKDVL